MLAGLENGDYPADERVGCAADLGVFNEDQTEKVGK